MFFVRRKSIEYGMAILLLLAVYLVSGEAARVTGAKAKTGVDVVIDAGHGGSDPGKVAADGCLEKTVNLSIAGKVQRILEKQGISVYMTREKDEMVHPDGKEPEKKEDMRLRCERISASGAKCAVSIHQNSFSDPSAHGAQVFYYTASEEGKQFADIMQKQLIRILDPSNTRVSKANDSYYLLRKTTIPLLIVECGFLSNPEEAKKLQEVKTQELAAEAIAEGIRLYLEKQGTDLAEY